MANREQVLDKIARNLDQLSISNARATNGVDVVAGGITISYEDADIQKPMGGVDGEVSPFLGIGIGNPGKINMKGDGGENTLAAIFDSEENLRILRVCTGHANDIIVEEGDTAAELARLPGSVDLLGMGM